MKIVVSPGPTFFANPFFKLFNAELNALGHELRAPRLWNMFRADIFHVNFPVHMVSEKKNLLRAIATASAMLCFMFIMRARGRTVVWTVHDVLPLRRHYPRLCTTYMVAVRKMVMGYIFLSKSSWQKFEELYPQDCHKPFLNAFHPSFPVRLLSDEERQAARKKLSVKPEDFVIGFLGDIKPYKNPDILRYIPERLDDGRETVLLVAGRADGLEIAPERHLAERRHINIKRRLDDVELGSLIQTVDVVLLPYIAGWNSGFLFLILSCRQKSVTSDLSIFLEMKDYFGNPWMQTFELSAADQRHVVTQAINGSAKTVSNDSDLKALNDQICHLSFHSFAIKVQQFYASLK